MFWARLARCLVLCWSLLLAASSIAHGADRRAVPDDAALDKATKEIREIYRTEYQQATSIEAKRVLADKLYQLALDTKEDAARYAALRISRDIGLPLGEVQLTRQAIDQLVADYNVDGLAMHVDALYKLESNVPSAQLVSYTDYATSIARQLSQQDRYTEALRCVGFGLDAARKAKLSLQSKRLMAFKEMLAELEPLAKDLAKHKETIAMSATDPEANLALGRFVCFYKEDWAQGIAMLALGSNEEVAKLAGDELAGGRKGEDLTALAMRWSALAENETPQAKASIQRHALKMLQAAKTDLNGLAAARAQKQIEAIAEALPPSFAPVATGDLHFFKEHYASAFSPDGRYLLTSDKSFVIHLWDLETLCELRQYKGATAKVGALAYFRDGQRFASISDDNKLRVWDIQGVEVRAVSTPSGGHQLLVSSDGKRVLCGMGAAYSAFDLNSGRPLFRHDLKFGEDVYIRDFSLDGRLAIVTGITNTVRVGDMKGKQIVFDGRSHCYDGALSSDGSHALTGGGTTVRLWKLMASGASQLMAFEGHTAHVYGVNFSADDRRALSTGADGSFRVWDLRTGQQLQSYPSSLGPSGVIQVSPDGRRATLRHGDTLRLVGLPE